MIRFAYICNTWLDIIVKNSNISIKDKIASTYLEKDITNTQHKSTNINVLLNRVKNNQKNESRKKLYFSALASSGLLLFVFAIF